MTDPQLRRPSDVRHGRKGWATEHHGLGVGEVPRALWFDKLTTGGFGGFDRLTAGRLTAGGFDRLDKLAAGRLTTGDLCGLWCAR